MNSRERFLAVIAGEKVDHPPLFPEGIREEVLRAWQRQGLAKGAALGELFHYDEFEQLDPDVYPSPEIDDWSDPERLLPILRRRLDADDPRRLPANWKRQAKRWQERDFPLFMRIHPGLLLSLGIGEWRSFAPALLRLVDEPESRTPDHGDPGGVCLPAGGEAPAPGGRGWGDLQRADRREPRTADLPGDVPAPGAGELWACIGRAAGA